MAVSKNAYKRYLIIDNALRRKDLPSMEKLLTRLESEGYPVSRSQVEKGH